MRIRSLAAVILWLSYSRTQFLAVTSVRVLMLVIEHPAMRCPARPHSQQYREAGGVGTEGGGGEEGGRGGVGGAGQTASDSRASSRQSVSRGIVGDWGVGVSTAIGLARRLMTGGVGTREGVGVWGGGADA